MGTAHQHHPTGLVVVVAYRYSWFDNCCVAVRQSRPVPPAKADAVMDHYQTLFPESWFDVLPADSHTT